MTDNSRDDLSPVRHVLHDLGYFGHYLHVNAGGRCGQQRVLILLSKHGGHMTQRELLDVLDIRSASLSEVLTKLEGAGQVERTRSEDDRRQLDVTLTEEGRCRAVALIEQRSDFEAQCLSCLSEEEQEQLVDMLDRLSEHWHHIEWKDIDGKEACA